MQNLVEVKNLKKSYGSKEAVKGISFKMNGCLLKINGLLKLNGIFFKINGIFKELIAW